MFGNFVDPCNNGVLGLLFRSRGLSRVPEKSRLLFMAGCLV